MNELLIYMLKTAIVQCLLTLCYRLLMQRDTFHKMVRCYFMGGLALSYIIPLIHFDFRILPPLQNNIPQLLQSAQSMTIQYRYSDASHTAAQWWQQYSFTDILTAILVAGMTVMVIRFVIQCLSLRRLRVYRHCRYKTHSIMNVDMPVKPFSFAKRIYINPKLHTAGELDEIIRHELVHINQYHSIDIIASTINRIIFWWNPVVTVLNGDIRNNLEYIVDSEMLQNGTGRKHYQYNILNISQITYTNGIANYFNLHNLKKRIKMMNKEKTQPVYKMKWLLLIPVATLILLSFNMKRAIATNVDFVVNSEIFEPEPAPVIEADTLVDKNFKPEELFIRCCDSAKSEPLIIINDNESDSKELAKLTADSIISFSILKEESAIKLFGEKGKNGVVIVMTKGYKNKGISIIVDKKDLDVDTHRLDFSTNSIKSSHNDSIDIIGLYSEEGKSGVIFGTTKDEEASNPRKQLLLESFPDSVLIIIDEKERDSKELQNLNPDTIRSIVIFKNNAAIEGYGEKGKNGVIVIETKESE